MRSSATGKVANAEALIWNILMVAQKKFRRLNARVIGHDPLSVDPDCLVIGGWCESYKCYESVLRDGAFKLVKVSARRLTSGREIGRLAVAPKTFIHFSREATLTPSCPSIKLLEFTLSEDSTNG